MKRVLPLICKKCKSKEKFVKLHSMSDAAGTSFNFTIVCQCAHIFLFVFRNHFSGNEFLRNVQENEFSTRTSQQLKRVSQRIMSFDCQ